jgi:ribonucleoside-diphosphate reductase alpha chain
MEFIPSTPCLINAGLGNGQLSSCFIINIEDNIESIYQTKSECAKIFQKNGGVGFNISSLRPKGTMVETSKGYSCGVCGFMEEFNLTADVVTRNNIRKGAIKIDLNDWHPDILEFIDCKNNTNKFTHMNISVSLSDKFMNTVKNDENWDLVFPDYSWNKEIYNKEWDGDLDKWMSKGYPIKIYNTVKAKDLYNKIMYNAWKTGEPGVSYRDIMDRDNPNPHLGKVTGSNPCMEFTSIHYNSCNLGSINLTKCVKNSKFDFNVFEFLIKNSIRFLDNMITINKLPIEKISKVTKSVRSVGLGVMGLADCLYMLKIPYNLQEGYKIIDKIFSFMKEKAIETSIELAKEKDVYPAWKGSKWEEKGIEIRNSNFLSIAPTGSISFIANTSGGLEPNFALVYSRRTNEGDIYYIINTIFENELKQRGIYSEKLLQKVVDNNGSCIGIDEIPKDMQKIFLIASDITPKQHAYVVGIIQKHVDLSASKTINLPNSATIKDIENIYIYAWDLGIKGITVYRDGCRENQTLTVKKNNQTIQYKDYSFLEWGTTIQSSDDLIGKKRKIITGCGSLHVTAWFDSYDGKLMELFLNKGSKGGCNSWMVSNSRTASASLRTGMDFNYLIDQLKSAPACPSYVTRTATKKDTSKGNCCPAAVANALIDMQNEVFDDLGIYDDDDKSIILNISNNNVCPECGEVLQFEGGCSQCISCGYSKCD